MSRKKRSDRRARRSTALSGKFRNRPAANHRGLRLEALEDRRMMAADMDVMSDVDALAADEPAALSDELAPPPGDADASPNRPGGGSSRPGPEPEPGPPPVRSIDGTDNNLQHVDWGSAGIQLLRMASPEYSDGIAEPAGVDRASAREISNLVAAQSESILNDRGLTDLVWQWGQFLDHDIDLTGSAEPAEAFPIEVPAGDPFFDPFGTGTQTIGLNRSVYDASTGDESGDPRQQLNQITAFIDGSNVYGSDGERADALRTFEGGRLKTSEGELLPFNEDGLENAGGPSSDLFLAGDVRANEQAGLTAMHTLWVREHNRIADEIAARDPQLSDEQIYQRARAIVIAEMQAITYNEFLPALLGRDALRPYQGYDPTVNPGISNAFSTAAYRFGHSMLSPELLRLDGDGNVIDEGHLALRDAFFNTAALTELGIDSLLRGLASQQAQEIDSQLVDDVRNFLFGPPGSGGFDLASLNIQRGRDHGLANFNQIRIEMGLAPIDSFADITSDPALQAALAEAYDGNVDNVDAWVGGLAEDHYVGASMGETNRAVLIDQFERLRDGDRFWYQRVFSGRQLEMIENTTLRQVIARNTDIDNLQPNVFFMPEAQRPRGNRPGGPGRERDNDAPPPTAPAPLPVVNLTDDGDRRAAETELGLSPQDTSPTAPGSQDQIRRAPGPQATIVRNQSDDAPRRDDLPPLSGNMFAEAADQVFNQLGRRR